MVMTPFGEHLDVVKHGWHGILKAFQDVAEAMKFANNHGILHRDISYGNIVFYEQHGYLIDWGVAVVGSPEVENALTGTILFSSVKVTTKLHENKKFTHTFDDDIESLFYTFLYVACDGVLKWKKGLGGMDFVAAMKFYTVYRNFSKQLEYVKNNELLPYLHRFRDIIVSNWTDKMAIDIDAVIRVFDIK
ncbi:9683_t:CDS:2 [Paraglomus occultum]|uniref:9683_t:CDS:1 n=1 Tax=Paraglomus occultum TaxID=144539 RepID=A0A9N9GXX2_9GLOM|nr:9683_t:CDS:2 [Paraglomus occultum]